MSCYEVGKSGAGAGRGGENGLVISESFAWALYALLVGVFVNLSLAMRRDRKDLKSTLDLLRIEVGDVKVMVARIDERVRAVESG